MAAGDGIGWPLECDIEGPCYGTGELGANKMAPATESARKYKLSVYQTVNGMQRTANKAGETPL